MIVLMGIVVVLSVFAISSLAADVADINIVISSERASSLLPEFNFVKETFALALNYNLAENITLQDNETLFYGNIRNIKDAFNQTRDEYYILELQHDKLFDAELNDPPYWVAHPGSTDNIYHVSCTISLEDHDACYTEDVLYSIVCKPQT